MIGIGVDDEQPWLSDLDCRFTWYTGDGAGVDGAGVVVGLGVGWKSDTQTWSRSYSRV